MNWTAEWIWNSGEESPRNEWWCFRKTFVISEAGYLQAVLSITADSRYVVYINGARLGRGPARYWPADLPYDKYEISRLLKPGANTIAVVVMHFGVSTFYYLRSRGGLLAQLDLWKDQEPTCSIGTDSTWATSRYGAQDSRAPRMSCQQAFTERIDARSWNDEWLYADFVEENWSQAAVIGKPGIAPWLNIKPSDAPVLTEESLSPVRVESLKKIVPVQCAASIDLRNHMVPDSVEHASVVGYAGFIAVTLQAAEFAKATIGFPQAFANFGTCWVNGKQVNEDDFYGESPGKYVDISLNSGDNLFVMDISGYDHGRGFHMAIDCAAEVRLMAPYEWEDKREGMTPFVTVGSFESRFSEGIGNTEKFWLHNENYKQALKKIPLGDFESCKQWLRPITEDYVSPEDVFTLSIWKRDEQPMPVPAALQQIVIPNKEAVSVPSFKDGDTEIVIDFGKELSGYISFELNASEGTILDFYGFEYMRDGWRQDTFALDNTMRYLCREGWQTYTSNVRRGFRYLMVTVRNAVRETRISNLQMIQSNYPIAEIGRFHSSDPLLNDIWHISQHTTRICMEDTFVDCPYEQTFWVGDHRNEALISYYLFGADDIVKRGLKLVPGSAYQTPLYSSHVPSGWRNVIPNFTFCWVISCKEYYDQTGDLRFVQEIWPHVAYTMDHYLEYLDDKGLLTIEAWNFVDWAPIEQPNDGTVTHQNLFMVRALKVAVSLAVLANDAVKAKEYRSKSADLRNSINRYLWSEERQAYIDCIRKDGTVSTSVSIQNQIIAYVCGVPTEERSARIGNYLSSAPPADFVRSGSPFISFFHYEGLASMGRIPDIVDDIRRNYTQMIEHEATACWEMYPEHTIGQSDHKALTRSHCHAWSAAPAYFLGAYVLGIRSLAPGWEEILVEPHPSGLSWARGAVPLGAKGRIDVAWKLDESAKAIAIQVRGPADVKVTIKAPAGYRADLDQTYWKNMENEWR